MIQITGWEKFQHYGKPKPIWIKLYRDLLGNYEFSRLTIEQRWTLVGLWLLAAETGNQIPPDLPWIRKRLDLTADPDLPTLETLGFIEVGEASREALEEVYGKKRRGEKRKRREEKTPTPSPPAFEGEFLSFWEEYPKKVGRLDALAAFQARRRAGVTVPEIHEGLRRYLAWATATDTKLKHPATFLGPKEWWAEPWTITEADTIRKKGNGKTDQPEVIDPKFSKVFNPVMEPRPAAPGGAK